MLITRGLLSDTLVTRGLTSTLIPSEVIIPVETGHSGHKKKKKKSIITRHISLDLTLLGAKKHSVSQTIFIYGFIKVFVKVLLEVYGTKLLPILQKKKLQGLKLKNRLKKYDLDFSKIINPIFTGCNLNGTKDIFLTQIKNLESNISRKVNTSNLEVSGVRDNRPGLFCLYDLDSDEERMKAIIDLLIER